MKTTMKLTTFTVTMLLATSALAGSGNSIILDVQGENTKPTISQDGSNNTAIMKIKNTVDETKIIQKGDGNKAEMDLNRMGDYTDQDIVNLVEINQDGQRNTARIKDEGLFFLRATDSTTPTARGYGSEFRVEQTGSDNKVDATLRGTSAPFNADGETLLKQTGTHNEMIVHGAGGVGYTDRSTSNGGEVYLDRQYVQEGNHNYADVTDRFTQRGDGNHITSTLSTGVYSFWRDTSSNQVQEGNSNTIVAGGTGKIRQTGDGNTARITMGSTRWESPSLTQTGNGNSFDGVLNSGYFANPSDVVQNGNNNTITGKFGGGMNLSTIISQTGNRNAVRALDGVSEAVNVLQSGNENHFDSKNVKARPDQYTRAIQDGQRNKGAIEGQFGSVLVKQTGSDNQAKATGRAPTLEAWANTATIDQNGSNHNATQKIFGGVSNISIDQDGTGHKANQEMNANMIASIQQVGTSHKAEQIAGDAYLKGGTDSTLTINQSGSKNFARQLGYANNSTQTITQTGTNGVAGQYINSGSATLDIDQKGDSNYAVQYSQNAGATGSTLKIEQSATSSKNYANQYNDGGNNDLLIKQNGSGHYALQQFIGSNNSSVIDQSGMNHRAELYITGNDNNLNVTQQGVGQNFAMTRKGNGMTLNITQK